MNPATLAALLAVIMAAVLIVGGLYIYTSALHTLASDISSATAAAWRRVRAAAVCDTNTGYLSVLAYAPPGSKVRLYKLSSGKSTLLATGTAGSDGSVRFQLRLDECPDLLMLTAPNARPRIIHVLKLSTTSWSLRLFSYGGSLVTDEIAGISGLGHPPGAVYALNVYTFTRPVALLYTPDTGVEQLRIAYFPSNDTGYIDGDYAASGRLALLCLGYATYTVVPTIIDLTVIKADQCTSVYSDVNNTIALCELSGIYPLAPSDALEIALNHIAFPTAYPGPVSTVYGYNTTYATILELYCVKAVSRNSTASITVGGRSIYVESGPVAETGYSDFTELKVGASSVDILPPTVLVELDTWQFLGHILGQR